MANTIRFMGRNKAYDRETVLERALDLFWKKGFEGAHLQELVKHTGLNRFGLYKEFGGKDGLFDEAMELYLSKANVFLDGLNQSPLGLPNILRFFKELDVRFFRYGCFATNTLAEKNVVAKSTYNRILKWMKDFEAAIRVNVAADLKRGALKKGVDVDSVVRFLAAVEMGIVMMSINHHQKDIVEVVNSVELFIEHLKT